MGRLLWVPASEAPQLQPFYSREDTRPGGPVQTATTALQHDIDRIKGTRGQPLPQLAIAFANPIGTAAIFRNKIGTFHGARGPRLDVQPLAADEEWHKPSTTVWFAERGGDKTKLVYKVNVPAEGSRDKPKNISMQLLVSSRQLTIRGSKDVLAKWAALMIVQFGPHSSVMAQTTKKDNIDFDAFWGA